jgi:hypothetical protein
MASSLTWLDFSERDRRRALDVIDLFSESGTVDELGIGTIRDSFSDLLFPGTSTIQTRACYFLLLPWLFQRLERLRVSSAAAPSRARQMELNLNERLLRCPDPDGVFGSSAGRALKRLPSAAYWGGLGTWGIRLYPGGISGYFHSLDGFYRREQRHRDLEADPEGREAGPGNWHPHIPEAPPDFPWQVTTELRREDSKYLSDRILSLHSGTLLAELVARGEGADLKAVFPWDLAVIADLQAPVREQLAYARLFSIAFHGAALTYNQMLAEALGDERPDWVEFFLGELAAWAEHFAQIEREVASWQLERMWTILAAAQRRIPYPTRSFVERWVELLLLWGGDVARQPEARQLIRDRELRLKGPRARLHHRRYLELWGGSSGIAPLDYRWPSTVRILEDVFAGLRRSSPHAQDA